MDSHDREGPKPVKVPIFPNAMRRTPLSLKNDIPGKGIDAAMVAV
jgi:hypothetical protein